MDNISRCKKGAFRATSTLAVIGCFGISVSRTLRLINEAHERTESLTVHIQHPAKPMPREEAWKNQHGKKTLFSVTKASNVKKHENNLCGSRERCSVRGYVTNPFLLFLDFISCAECTWCKPHKSQYNNILNQSPKNQGCSQTQAHPSSRMLLFLLILVVLWVMQVREKCLIKQSG